MTMVLQYKSALIVGAGHGLSAALARLFVHQGMKVGLAARTSDKVEVLAASIGAASGTCDATQPDEVASLFDHMDQALGGPPDVVVYNPSARVRGALIDLDPGQVAHVLNVSAYGGFLVAQAAAKRMVPKRHGAIFFTGASASEKGYALSAPFAMGKFALRGLAQSLARELHPQGIHVAHFIIDGAIRGAARPEPADRPDSFLDPDAIARSYLSVLQQDRSAWSWEMSLRPWVEVF